MGNLVKQNHCQLQVEEGRGLGDGDCAEVFNKLDFAKRGCRICTQSSIAGDCDTIVELSGTNGGALCDNGVFSLNEQTLHSKSIDHSRLSDINVYMLLYGRRLFHRR